MNIETSRLVIQKLTPTDAPFICGLVNTPGWLRFIGDRGVKNEMDARRYLHDVVFRSYDNNGFGLCIVLRKSDKMQLGMCGLLKRTYLPNPDIGFAFFPAFEGNGYATEAVMATMSFSEKNYQLKSLNAITTPDNARSQRVLKECGFIFEKEILNDASEELFLFTRHL